MLQAQLPAMVAVVLLAACATPQPPACTGDGQPAWQETLYFGTQRPAGDVTPAQWQAFVAEVLTPAFPAGLTWWTANGQWQGQGELMREAAYVLQLVLPPDEAAGPRLHAVIAEYKQRFDQSSVLRTWSSVCLSYNQ